MTRSPNPGRCPRCSTTVDLYRDVRPVRTGGFTATCAECGEKWHIHKTLTTRSEADRVERRKKGG